MHSRRLILGLILLTLLATCLAAAAKLRATPKYDRIQVGMIYEDALAILGPEEGVLMGIDKYGKAVALGGFWLTDEGMIEVEFQFCEGRRVVLWTDITPRSPLERLAWLAGWR